MDLRGKYRTQHDLMVSNQQGSKLITTRRQAHFRPRGKVYVNLLRLEIRWDRYE